MYFRGEAVARDLIEAHAWCQIAAAHGVQDAINNLALIEKEMSPAQKAEAAERARKLPLRAR